MKNNISFSIIMPCYNSEDYVASAIESVLNQTYSNLSLIIINDGSTDSTADIISKYANLDNRIKIFTKENGGYVSAINVGLDNVSSDYFLLMGSDDRLFPDLLNQIVCAINNDLPDLIGFRTVRYVDGVSEGIDGATNFITKEERYNISIKQYENLYPKHAEIFFVRDTSKCFKTSVLKNLRMFGKFGLDADGIFSSLFAHQARSFMSLPVDGYRWTIRENSLSAKIDLNKSLDRLSNWNLFFQNIKNLPENEITESDKDYVKCCHSIARRTAAIINIKDRQQIKIFRNNVKPVFSLYRKYKIKVGWKNWILLILLSKFPKCWIRYIKRKRQLR